MTEILATLAQLSVLVFVIGSMASMGLSLKMAQIIAPSRTSSWSSWPWSPTLCWCRSWPSSSP